MIKNKYNVFRKLRNAAYEALPFLRPCKNMFNQLKLKRFRRRLGIRRDTVARTIAETGKYPLFDMIEVETVNRCNGDCDFCPVNRHKDPRKTAKMTTALFESIILQLESLDYSGSLHLYSNNEPLIDERIADFAALARRSLPRARIVFSTNGLLLTEEKYRSIIDSVDVFTINNYCEDYRLTENNLKIHDLSQTNPDWAKRTEVAIRYRKELLNTRGSAAPNRSVALPPVLPVGCTLPTRQIVVRPDGKLSLCCNDTLGTMTMGDLNESSLLDIWYSPRYDKVRERILDERAFLNVCKHCDTIQGHV